MCYWVLIKPFCFMKLNRDNGNMIQDLLILWGRRHKPLFTILLPLFNANPIFAIILCLRVELDHMINFQVWFKFIKKK